MVREDKWFHYAKDRLFIQANDFASAFVARVDGENSLFSQWRGKQQLCEVFRENFDGFLSAFSLASCNVSFEMAGSSKRL